MNAASRRILTTPRLLIVGLFLFAACHRQGPTSTAPAPTQPPTAQRPPAPVMTSGNMLIRAMRDRYPAWYRSVTFVQKTTINRPSGGELLQTWYEAASLPGKLRIDTDIATKSGTLFAHDSIYGFASGKLTRADTGLNELLVLGFDVYTQPAIRTENQLRRLGFNLGPIHEALWRGHPVYVVGAAIGDSTTKQFWVDKENLLFIRALERGPQGHVDVRFEKYEKVSGGWIAMQVVQFVNGKPRLTEEYSDVHVNVPLSNAMFDPAQWSTAAHWAKPSPSRNKD